MIFRNSGLAWNLKLLNQVDTSLLLNQGFHIPPCSNYSFMRRSTDTPQLKELSRNPLVSIIVPSYNQGQYIRRTIDSILQQDYRPIKIHVIDGASNDETRDVLESYGDIPELDWVSEPDKGVVDAVNKGFTLINGEIAAIQSSDDAYLPGAIRKVVETLQATSSVALVYGDVIKIDQHDSFLSSARIPAGSLCDFLAKKTWVMQPAAFFRSQLSGIDVCWDDRIPYTPDVDLWMRIWFRYSAVKIDQPLAYQRIHDEQRDHQHLKIRRDWTLMIDQSADIKKAGYIVKLAAVAGKHRNAWRYGDGSDWAQTYHAWLSCLLWPRNFPAAFSAWRVMIPGYVPLMRILSCVKRNLFGLPPRKS